MGAGVVSGDGGAVTCGARRVVVPSSGLFTSISGAAGVGMGAGAAGCGGGAVAWGAPRVGVAGMGAGDSTGPGPGTGTTISGLSRSFRKNMVWGEGLNWCQNSL